MQNLIDAKRRKIELLTREDILSYGIFNVDLLENKRWKIRPWDKDIYKAVNPADIERTPVGLARQLIIQKSTQCGMSTMAAVRLFHFSDFWATRSIYMLPRQQDYIDFVTTRVDPMIARSDRLAKLLGSPDSTRAKQLGNSYVFFMESTVEPRMMPADAVFIDEFDLSDMRNVATAQNRMDDSWWKLKYFYSTPTVPNYGINAAFESSNKQEWFIKCSACNHYQILNWDKNLRIIGNPRDPSKVFFGCQRCDKELTREEINSGMWVPEFPERTSKSIGFHISQMMSHDPLQLYYTYIDPLTKLYEFYRKNLGMPYELGIGSIEREDLLATCFDEPYLFERVPDGKSRYYMGVDQGNELQVLIGKLEQGSNRPKVVGLLSISFEKGFKELDRLIRIFKPDRVVIDADPNRHSAREIQKEYKGKVYLADYGGSTDWSIRVDPKTGIKSGVVIGRSEGFDRLIEDIKEGGWQLPGSVSDLPQDTETLIDHITALKRDIEVQRTASGEKEVAVWRELRASHFAHSWLYLKTAIEIAKGKNYRVAAINLNSTQQQSVEDAEKQEEFINISVRLAEVPTEQLDGYIRGKFDPEDLPFPLSFKIRVLSEKHSDDMIEYTIRKILSARLNP